MTGTDPVTLLIAITLALLLVLPADGYTYEFVRARHEQVSPLWRLILGRMLITVTQAGLMATAVTVWAKSGPLGPTLLVFAGAMMAAWLWMWYWIKTYIAEPGHPTRRITIVSVILTGALSATLWFEAFTFQALLQAWVDTPALDTVILLSLIWVAIDALWLALLASQPWGTRLIASHTGQSRLNRSLGLLLLALSLWAMVAVL
ncbi:hypothetical protein [Saccharospirillum impatiens]|uniref:hypothetical protein n=1 Tax=Saccharospirillum impatiens TaxID=169438 RepID=UPI0003F5F632|nr:hypothetical protein [Saccharospirillum impatiens]